MPSRELDAETLREVFVYLFRCWLQRHIGVVPQRLGLSAIDGVLVSETFSLYYNTQCVSEELLTDLRGRLTEPFFLFSPSLPPRALGSTNFKRRTDVPAPFAAITSLINKNLAWLEEHKERALEKSEAYEKLDHGAFAIWRGKSATRLILHPVSAEVYGYVVVRNGPKDYFLLRSKSCKEEGKSIGRGEYKRTQHRMERSSNINFDLLMEGGDVLLLHLTLAGAGYKAFPRQTPEPEFDKL